MSESLVISLVGLIGSLVIALVAILSLLTSRQLLIRVGKQLEIAESQSEMNLIRNAFIEMSEFLQIFVEKPHLRPYFYDDLEVPADDELLRDEVNSMAEWILTNFATAISLSVMIPNYPIGSLKETIRFHLRQSQAMRNHLKDRFMYFPVSGLTLLRLTYDSKTETLVAIDEFISEAERIDHQAEVKRLKAMRTLLESAKETDDLKLAAYGLAGSRARTQMEQPL